MATAAFASTAAGAIGRTGCIAANDAGGDAHRR
jgi:hypothetical protein